MWPEEMKGFLGLYDYQASKEALKVLAVLRERVNFNKATGLLEPLFPMALRMWTVSYQYSTGQATIS